MKYIKIRNVTSLLFLLAAVFFLSNEANAQWTQVAKPNGVTVQALVSVGTNIFAGFNGYNTHYGGIYRSIDDGDTWIAVDSGLVKFGDDTLNILCLAAMGDTIVAGTDSDGIFISTNNGDSWEQMNNGIADSSNQILDITAVATHNSKIYAAGIGGLGVFVSSNAGQSWDSIDTGLPHTYFGTPAIYVNAFGFIGPYIYLTGYTAGTYVSTDGGSSWMLPTADTIGNEGGNCFANIGNVIFLGVGDNAYNSSLLWSSTNNGKSWIDISTSYDKISGSAFVSALAVYDMSLIVGSDYGVYTSSDSGTTWIPFNKGWGKEYMPIMVNVLTINNSYIFAGINGHGVWRIPLSQIVTSVKEPKETLPVNYSLSQNYPNPFNPSTVINYQLSAFSNVELDVYNVLGEKVAELVNKEQPAGTYKVTFNGNNLSSGIYLYKLQAKNYTSVKKMVLLK